MLKNLLFTYITNNSQLAQLKFWFSIGRYNPNYSRKYPFDEFDEVTGLTDERAVDTLIAA